MVIFLKVVMWLFGVGVILYGGTVLFGFIVYKQERKESAGWGVAIIARIGAVVEQIVPIMECWDGENLSVKQSELIRKFVGASEGIPEKVHEYMKIIQTPWLCGTASRLKAEVEKQVKELEALLELFERENARV